MNRSRRLELFQLACKKKSFLSPINRQVTNSKPFRRQSCHCSECGAIGAFQDRQNAQYPQTYIRAHHCKKRKRRLQRRKGTHITSNSLNMGQSQHTNTTIPPLCKLRKAKSICLGQQQLLQVQKCKRLLTKDDQQISYQFFYNNELKFSKGFMDASECSSCRPSDAAALISFINMTKMPTFVLNSLNNTINESRTSSDEDQHQQRVSQKQLISSKIPSVKIKHTSLHSRKLTEGIMHVSVNRTVQQFVKSCTTITLNSTPKPQQKQIVLPSIHSKRDIKQSVYLLSSPRKALLELKCQISSQKKIRVFKK